MNYKITHEDVMAATAGIDYEHDDLRNIMRSNLAAIEDVDIVGASPTYLGGISSSSPQWITNQQNVVTSQGSVTSTPNGAISPILNGPLKGSLINTTTGSTLGNMINILVKPPVVSNIRSNTFELAWSTRGNCEISYVVVDIHGTCLELDDGLMMAISPREMMNVSKFILMVQVLIGATFAAATLTSSAEVLVDWSLLIRNLGIDRFFSVTNNTVDDYLAAAAAEKNNTVYFILKSS